MPYSEPCPLCNTNVDSAFSGRGVEDWKASLTLLELEHDGPTLITPPVTFMLRHDQHAVHSACWSILNGAVLSKDISHRWLGSIREIFEDLEPHFAEIQWPERPEFLEGSWQSIPAPEANKLDSSVIGTFGNIFLPVEILQVIHSHLECYDDVRNFTRVIGVDPAPAAWLALGKTYFGPGLASIKGTRRQIADIIERILWNVHNSPTCLPHIANYCAVWENVKLTLSILAQTIRGSDISSVKIDDRCVVRCRDVIGALKHQKSLPLKSPCKLTVHFTSVRTRDYLCGLQINDDCAGYTGNLSLSTTIEEFRGLRIALDDYGFLSLQVKDGKSWQLHTCGTLPPNEIEYLSFAQLEWPICQDSELILCLDTFKIQTISYHSQDLEEELPHFSIWHGGFPSPYLTPSVLFDRFPNEGIRPCTFLDQGLDTVISISAFVDTWWQSLSGIEFTFRGKSDTARLGRPAKTFTKLSFNLDWEQGEIILGAGCAVAHHNQGLSIKFFTNFGRSVIFGGPILGDWHTIKGIAGIYCSSAIFCHTFPDGSMPFISFFGVLKECIGSHNLIVDDVATIEVTTWPQEIVTFDKNESVLGFVSRSDLTSISGITVYAESLLEEARLTGIKIYHFDRNPDLLGEAREEIHTFSVADDLIKIETYYSMNHGSLCQIRGFRFCFELGLVELGNTESVLQRDIAVCKSSPTVVYWIGKVKVPSEALPFEYACVDIIEAVSCDEISLK
ncbi:hypothetical protein LOY87_005804 [Ophidiomyces ophidiicola]|nr:hypothetical protein LOY87_005804 [Ophidiomyces ophidiicola]